MPLSPGHGNKVVGVPQGPALMLPPDVKGETTNDKKSTISCKCGHYDDVGGILMIVGDG